MTAPVVGSGSCPAWMAAVCGPMGDSVAMAACSSCRRRVDLEERPRGPECSSRPRGRPHPVIGSPVALALLSVALAAGLAAVVVVLTLIVPVATLAVVARAV